MTRWPGIAELSASLPSFHIEVNKFEIGSEEPSLTELINWVLKEATWIPFSPDSCPMPGFPLNLPTRDASKMEDTESDVIFEDGVIECREDFRGRFLTAARDLDAGQTLIKEKPFASIVNQKHNKVVCCFCKCQPIPEETKITCESCEVATWCSERCQSESMAMFHQYECPYLSHPEKMWLIKSRPFRLAARMVIKGWKNVLHHFLTVHCDSNTNKIDGNEKEFDLVANESSILHYFQKPNQNQFQWTRDLPSLDDQLESFVAMTMLHHFIRLKCNSFESFHSRVGLSIYLKIAQINHSCRPNCNNFFRGDTHIIRASKKIAKGEEIFIIYDRAVRFMPDKKDRKQHMLTNFGFNCFCIHCNTEDEDLQDLYFMEETCSEISKQKVKNLINRSQTLMRSKLPEKAERCLYAAKAAAAEAKMFKSEAEIDEVLNEVQGDFDNERVCYSD